MRMLYCDCYETIHVDEEMLASCHCGKGDWALVGEDCVGSFGCVNFGRSIGGYEIYIPFGQEHIPWQLGSQYEVVVSESRSLRPTLLIL